MALTIHLSEGVAQSIERLILAVQASAADIYRFPLGQGVWASVLMQSSPSEPQLLPTRLDTSLEPDPL
jgi:hypothetical protein